MKQILRNINLSTLVIFLLLGSRLGAKAQNATSLQGELKNSKGTVMKGARVYLIWPDIKTAVDSTSTDSAGNFLFEKIPPGNYSIGLNTAEVDNSYADVININSLNPHKRKQHFRIDDGALVCVESNYTSIKDALENKENVFTLNLNSLQHDVAEKSLLVASDGVTKKLSPKIGEFTNLESLSLDINLINALPAEMGNLTKLTALSASLNKLAVLPPEMAALKNMKSLSLGKNGFTAFPDLITGYSMLESLNLESNPIPALPASIGSLKKLKTLNLAGCTELTELPVQMGELTALEELNLSNCYKLKSIPKEMYVLQNLKTIDVSGSKISAGSLKKAMPWCEVIDNKK